MPQIAINTSQNINIHFAIASIGERIVAFVLDMLIKIAFLIVLFLLITEVFNLGYVFKNMDKISRTAIISFLSLPFYIYTLVLESIMQGQTFGKKIMKIKVVKIDGYQASFADYLMRWLFRMVEIFATSGVVAVISIITTKNSQRLGDMASGTAVISLKNRVNISQTILVDLAEDYIPKFPQVIALSDNDVRIIKDNFNKALRAKDANVLSALTEKIQEVIHLEVLPDVMTQEEFIHTILKDYNYYTGK